MGGSESQTYRDVNCLNIQYYTVFLPLHTFLGLWLQPLCGVFSKGGGGHGKYGSRVEN